MSSSPTPQPVLHSSKLALQTLLGLVFLVIGLGVASYFLRGWMEEISQNFISVTGVWGVGLGFFFPDAFTLPIPPDTFLVAGLLGKLSFTQILFSASIGSILGGTLGFLMIRSLSTIPKVEQWLDQKVSKGKAFMNQYGLWALAIGALTPLPYSMMCWACGIVRVRFIPFFLISLLRIPRVALYILLIEQTLNQVG
jgi:membrane protein YqaA with SNARE-associated domain